MKSFSEIKRLLQEEAKPYLTARYPITEIGVFGSYVRGEADADSDLDVLLETAQCKPASGFMAVDIEEYLTELTGIKTQVVMKSTLRNRYLRENILNELALV